MKCCTSVPDAVPQREVMRNLLRYPDFGRRVTKAFPIQREVMLVETVHPNVRVFPFANRLMPVEVHIYVCILVRNVRNALSVRQCILSAACCPLLFLVAGVKVVERTSQIEPVAVTVSQRHIEPFVSTRP